ncbi:scavenger receptor cysteine-rich type 1 protein M160-like [Nelusetta ayraudi]|uniref:scavenger receptor cysteine-rich type 1 protein M160-like n=1 Tax=Nelusetta ayraudi TaxID=303726 RepID=UPI003F70DBF4
MIMFHAVLMVFVALWGSVAPQNISFVRGSSPCSGSLELTRSQYRRRFIRKINEWGLVPVAAVCRQLNCGAALSTHTVGRSRQEPGGMPSTTVVQKFNCSEYIRLEKGTQCSGILEIRSNLGNKSWSAVCKEDFDELTAEVACRELSCGAPSSIQEIVYEERQAPSLTTMFHCQDRESALRNCLSFTGKVCTSKKAVNLTCSEPNNVRLVGGKSGCRGTLEMRQGVEWRGLRKLPRGFWWAGRVCSQLNCGSVISVGLRRSNSPTTKWAIVRDCDESSLADCYFYDEYSSINVEITCSDATRLVNGTDTCSGRLQVKPNLEWLSVCAEGFTQQSAQVACRELGCGVLSAMTRVFTEQIETPTWKSNFHCRGNESSLKGCRKSPRERTSCFPGEAVWLCCSDPDDLRLVGGTSRCNGRVQLKHDDEWRDLVLFLADRSASTFICHWLSCGSPISLVAREKSTPSIWVMYNSCVQSDASLRDCVTTFDQPWDTGIEIYCSDSVRLINETSACSGMLGVKSNGSWFSVCEKDLTQQNAEVFCRELGCGPPSSQQLALHGNPGEEVVAQNIHCQGNESVLLDCQWLTSARDECSSSQSVTLTCFDNVRLSGAKSRCAGTLEMAIRGEWRRVIADGPWDRNSTAVLCEQLGCGSAVSESTIWDNRSRPIWEISTSCIHTTSALSDCVVVKRIRESSESQEVICSGLLAEPNISLSSSAFGFSNVEQKRFYLLLGSNFTVTCSAKPQYQGGFFQLLLNDSGTVQNYTTPAVNHSANFLFYAADHTHQGDYRCFYHNNVFSHNFSSQSQTLSLILQASVKELIIRLVIVLLGMMLQITAFAFYTKAALQRP